MSLFDNLNQAKTGGRMNPQQALAQLMKDPAGTLKAAGLNIPAGLNNPQQIVNHLLQSGQISNQRLQIAQRMMGMFGRR